MGMGHSTAARHQSNQPTELTTMKIKIQQLFISLALPFGVWGQIHPSPANFGVVNIIPLDQSSETDQNSEPSLGVGTGSKSGKLVVHTFRDVLADYSVTQANPYYTSVNGGILWTTNGTFSDFDTALDWSSAGTAYAVIDGPTAQNINVLK